MDNDLYAVEQSVAQEGGAEANTGSNLDSFRTGFAPVAEKVAGTDANTVGNHGFSADADLLAQLFGDASQQGRTGPGTVTLEASSAVDTQPIARQGDIRIVLPQEALDALQKKLPLDEQGDRRYIASALQMGQAEDLIEKLPTEKKQEWNNFQERLSKATSFEEAEAVRKERNSQFPEIAKHIEAAKKLMEQGDELHRLKKQEDQIKRAPDGENVLDLLRRGQFPVHRQTEGNPVRLKIPGFDATGTPQGEALDLASPFKQKKDETSLDQLLKPFPDRLSGASDYNLMRSVVESRICEIENPAPVKVQGDKLVDDLRARGVPAADLERFSKDLEQFLERKESTPEQKAETLTQVERLLTTNSNVGLTEQQRIRLAEQIINQVADTRSLDQGPYNTCNVTTAEKVLSARHPEQVARTITELALTGTTRTERGSTVTLDATSLQPASAEAVAYPDAENVRTHASQLFQLAAIQQKWDKFNKDNGTDLRYVNAGGVNGDVGDYLMDYSTTPPSKVYGFEHGKPVHESTQVKGPNGEPILDENLQPVVTKPIQDPGFTLPDALNVIEQFSGKSADGIGLMHYSVMPIGTGNPFYNVGKMIYSGAGYNADCTDPRIKGFRSPEQLKEMLETARKENRFPLILQVHTGGGFLREQVVEASGGAGGAGDAEVGGGHVVTINDYDPRTGKVDVDNQWGNSRDRLGTKGATTVEVDEIARVVPEVAARAEKQNQQIKERQQEYLEWAKQQGIEPFTRYPSKAELESYRKSR